MTDYLAITLDKNEIDAISCLGLAHVGDAVYELMVRSWLCAQGRLTSRRMHNEAVRLVRADAQAHAYESVKESLSQEEEAVFRRARNAKVYSPAHKANSANYHAATAMEALFGWLYLNGEHSRLNELFLKIMEDSKTDAT